MRRVSLLLLLLLLVAPPALSQTANDELVIPGVRGGKWTLKMSVDDLVRMNGPAIRILHTAGVAPDADVVRDFTSLDWDTVFAGTFDAKRVEFLGITFFNRGARLSKTTRGIGFQSTRAKVLKAYGKPTAETQTTARRDTADQ